MKYSIKNKQKRKKNIQNKKSIKKKGGAAYDIAKPLLLERIEESNQNVTPKKNAKAQAANAVMKPKSLKKKGRRVTYNRNLQYNNNNNNNNNNSSSCCLPEWCLPDCLVRGKKKVNFGNNYYCCELGKKSAKKNGKKWRENLEQKISKKISEKKQKLFLEVSDIFPKASVPLKDRISVSIDKGNTTLEDILYYKEMLRNVPEEDIPQMIYNIVKGEITINEIIQQNLRSNDNDANSVRNNNLEEEDDNLEEEDDNDDQSPYPGDIFNMSSDDDS